MSREERRQVFIAIVLSTVLLAFSVLVMSYDPPHPHQPAGNCLPGLHFSSAEGICR